MHLIGQFLELPDWIHLSQEQRTNLMEIREADCHGHLCKPLGADYFSRSYQGGSVVTQHAQDYYGALWTRPR